MNTRLTKAVTDLMPFQAFWKLVGPFFSVTYPFNQHVPTIFQYFYFLTIFFPFHPFLRHFIQFLSPVFYSLYCLPFRGALKVNSPSSYNMPTSPTLSRWRYPFPETNNNHLSFDEIKQTKHILWLESRNIRYIIRGSLRN